MSQRQRGHVIAFLRALARNERRNLGLHLGHRLATEEAERLHPFEANEREEMRRWLAERHSRRPRGEGLSDEARPCPDDLPRAW